MMFKARTRPPACRCSKNSFTKFKRLNCRASIKTVALIVVAFFVAVNVLFFSKLTGRANNPAPRITSKGVASPSLQLAFDGLPSRPQLGLHDPRPAHTRNRGVLISSIAVLLAKDEYLLRGWLE